MNTLDQQLLDLCDRNGLNNISISVYTLNDGTRFFGVTAQDGINCGTSKRIDQSIADCIPAAIADLHAKQGMVIPALALVEMAA